MLLRQFFRKINEGGQPNKEAFDTWAIHVGHMIPSGDDDCEGEDRRSAVDAGIIQPCLVSLWQLGWRTFSVSSLVWAGAS